MATNRIKAYLTETCTVALLWVVLFEINRWLFSLADVSIHISWIFLPAALRILSVLLLDWRGVIGLFFGALLTNHPVVGVNMTEALMLSSISALAPMLAVRVCTGWLKISHDLAGLSFKQLAAISAVGALISAALHNIYFQAHEQGHRLLAGLVSMLCGDLLGTLVVLYLCAKLLRRLAHNR